jgi:uncharacterized protein YbjT (DUF2867 family)
MFFISGITGKVGGAAARRLLEQGHKVRGLARDPQRAAEWTAQGVEIEQGDFNDTDTLVKALDGVEGAFVMSPPNMAPSPDFAEAKAIAVSLRKALETAPPPRVAVLSSIGSQQTSKLGLITATHILEQELGVLDIPIAFLRPGSFLENFTYALQAAQSGFFDTFNTPTSLKVPMVATTDIGNEVAALLTATWSGRRIIELGTLYTADDLADALTSVLNKLVQARAIPRDHWAATLQAMGMPAAAIAPYEQMADSINSGWISFGVPGTERLEAAMTPKQFLAAAAGKS